ncbi:MAG: class I SAM-dependent methyltransferase, partial [Planctomycetota bacterium]
MVRKPASKPKKARSHESRIYDQFSRFYERIFARFLSERIHSTIRSLEIPPGARVLEVGVGTGLSLPAYPEHVEVTGIDIAEKMLAQAQEKVDECGWRHVELRAMDALAMDFPDEHFDYVMAFHIVSVVPDPERLIREMLRVAKVGATVVIINHFRSERKWLARLIDLLDPITRRFGWRTTLRLSDVVDGAPLCV